MGGCAQNIGAFLARQGVTSAPFVSQHSSCQEKTMGAGNPFLRFVCVEAATCAGVVMVVMQVNTDPAACFPDLINMAHLRQALATQTNSCFYCRPHWEHLFLLFVL